MTHPLWKWSGNIELSYDPAILLLGEYPQRNENICLQKNLGTNGHSSIIHNSQKVETTQMPINEWKDKQNMIYLWTGILFSHKKKWSINICYKIDVPWIYYAKWKKPDTKTQIFYNSIYMKYLEYANP